MQNQTDSSIISRILAGDESALNILYKQHYQSVYHLIYNNNGSDDEAKDIYQEAVIIFYEKIREESFKLTCSISTFLYAVARRLWLKRLTEKRKYNTNISDFEEELAESDLVSENEIHFQKMNSALSEIGNPCKEILEDYYIHNLSMNNITEKFGYTNTDNAKNQKYKCLVRLKKLFFKQDA